MFEKLKGLLGLEKKVDSDDNKKTFTVTIEHHDGTKCDVEIEPDKLLDVFEILFSDMKQHKQKQHKH